MLGIAEGGLLPGMVLYLSGMYTRGEMALRIGLFYTAASLSGAFGGLLARGLSAIGPRGNLEGWRWIFIIEGLLVSFTRPNLWEVRTDNSQTVVCGVIAYLFLPSNLATASFMKPEERAFAINRLSGHAHMGGPEGERFK